MNELISAVILAIVQGITEWLPVSSSGHLLIAEKLLNYKGSLTFDVALHFGTLMAVFVYFGKDITEMMKELLMLRFNGEKGKMGLFLLISAIPAAIAGFFLKDIFEVVFSDFRIISLGFGITGLVLMIASLELTRKKKELNAWKAFVIGLGQIISLFPGISRSGTTLSTGLLLDLNEKTALKFSFLMAIPVVFGANVLAIGNEKLPAELIWATLVSFVIGLLMLHVLYKYILTTRRNLRYFGAYALLLALVLFLTSVI